MLEKKTKNFVAARGEIIYTYERKKKIRTLTINFLLLLLRKRSYVRRMMFPDNADVLAIAEMKSLVESAEAKLARLKNTRNELKAKLERLEKDGYPEAAAEADEGEEGDDDEGLL